LRCTTDKDISAWLSHEAWTAMWTTIRFGRVPLEAIDTALAAVRGAVVDDEEDAPRRCVACWDINGSTKLNATAGRSAVLVSQRPRQRSWLNHSVSRESSRSDGKSIST
jgi:hypothetical protein